MSRQPLTPDFITHQWQPIESATLEDGFIRVTWLDGLSFDAYSLWLAENAEGYGLEPLSRERTERSTVPALEVEPVLRSHVRHPSCAE